MNQIKKTSIRKEAIKLILEENSVAAADLIINAPVQFLQYSMEYLKIPIIYSFKKPVTINQSKYNMKIGKIQEIDRKNISELLISINKEIQFNENFTFMNCQKDCIIDDENENYMIKIKIQGTKDGNQSIRPIWKIIEANCN